MMPAPATRDDLLTLVGQSGLVADDRRDDFLRRHKGRLPRDPAPLADLFVHDGLLTRFQADQLLAGKWRGFTIGKYKVLERLGSGGMGQVFLCEHEQMRRRVALKVLPDAAAHDPSTFQRFQREARAGAAVDHPNVVRVYDVDADGNRHFIVMEYVEGQSLHELVARHGPLDVPRACNFIRQAAEGLQHAHEAGLIHRDVKPANILVDKQGVVKLLDLGLARFAQDNLDMLTKQYDDNNVLGTADYVAPEQTRDSHDVDVRADIYALGGTFYFVLTGRPPFAEGTVAQKLIWHQTKPPPRIHTLRPDLPPGLATVVEKMMAKRREDRYPTPADVVRALAPWASPSGSTPAAWDLAAHTPPAGTYAVPPPAGPAKTNPFAVSVAKPFGDLPVPPRAARPGVGWVLVLVLGIALGLAAGWWLVTHSGLVSSATPEAPNDR